MFNLTKIAHNFYYLSILKILNVRVLWSFYPFEYEINVRTWKTGIAVHIVIAGLSIEVKIKL